MKKTMLMVLLIIFSGLVFVCQAVSLDQLIREKKTEELKEIIENKDQVNIRDNYGQTLLMIAVIEADFEIVKYLVNQGASLDARDYEENTVLHFAAETGNLKMLKFLVDNLEKKQKELAEEAKKAAEKKAAKEDVTKEEAAGEEEKPVVKVINRQGMTPLHIAAEMGHTKIAEYLVDKGADPEIRNRGDNNTPLDLALAADNLKIVKHLVAAGADPNTIDNQGNSLLHIFTKNGDLDMVKKLIKNEAEINSLSNQGETPLDIAQAKNYKSIEKFLKSQGGESGSCPDCQP
jgi:ankyrin repeat protein